MGLVAFKKNDKVVYPNQGVGEVIEIETQHIGEQSLNVYVISFQEENTTVRVPTARAVKLGLRPVVTLEDARVIANLIGSPTKKLARTPWAKRVKDYENKLQSGELLAVTEVLKDTYLSHTNDTASFSERQIFNTAMQHILREFKIVFELTETEARDYIQSLLEKSSQ